MRGTQRDIIRANNRAAFNVDVVAACDGRGLSRREVRVAVNHAAELRLHHRRRVVQDRAALLYVEPVVGVDRDASAGRTVDVDLFNTVRRLDDVGCVCAAARNLCAGQCRHGQRERRERKLP
nr:hypothetical protein [Paraburkholderia tropica]